jgi:AraC-like DNA-binding protein
MNNPASRKPQPWSAWSSSFVGLPWKDLRPALAAAVCLVFWPKDRMKSWRQSDWVIDYNYNPLGRVGIDTSATGARQARTKQRRRNAAQSPHALRWWPRLEPTLHLYAPGVEYHEEYSAKRAGPVRVAFAMIRGGESAGLDRLLSPAGFARFLDPSGLVGQIIRDIALLGEGPVPGSAVWKAQSMLFDLCDLLHSAAVVDSYTRRVLAPAQSTEHQLVTLAMRVKRYLTEHLGESVALRDIADELGLSESSLSHRYRLETGTTPIATLLRMRIDMAKEMLLEGDSLKQIADRTCFADSFHLSRTFKRLEGCSPTEYRKSSPGAGQD